MVYLAIFMVATRTGSNDSALHLFKTLSKRLLILEPIDNFTTSKTY